MTERPVEWPGAAERPRESGAAGPGRGGRMSRRRKRAAALRLLRGGDLETVSRSHRFKAAEQAGRLDEIPANHAPDFAPVIHPTLRTGIEAMPAAAGAWLAAAAAKP